MGIVWDSLLPWLDFVGLSAGFRVWQWFPLLLSCASRITWELFPAFAGASHVAPSESSAKPTGFWLLADQTAGCHQRICSTEDL